MVKILKAEDYREGRWLNGLGLSWDIAATPPDADAQHFEWRMALARIDSSVAFSYYHNVDRIFMLIEGHGLDLVFDDRELMKVDQPFLPHEFFTRQSDLGLLDYSAMPVEGADITDFNPLERACEQIERNAHKSINRHLGHDAAHQCGDMTGRSRMSQRQPGMERDNTRL